MKLLPIKIEASYDAWVIVSVKYKGKWVCVAEFEGGGEDKIIEPHHIEQEIKDEFRQTDFFEGVG